MPPPWLIICIAITLIGITKSGFGSGLGLIVVPICSLAMQALPGYGAKAALPLLLPLLIVGDVFAFVQNRKFANYSLIWKMIPGTIVGIALGTTLIWIFNNQKPVLAAHLINLEIGVESIVLVSLHWWRQWRGLQSKLMPEPSRTLLTTAFAGTSSTLAHAAGPVISMYLLPLRLPRQTQVATSSMYFFFTNCAKLPTFFMTGLFAQVQPAFALRFAPLVIAGAMIGWWINRKLSDHLFSRVVYIAVFLLGFYISADAILGLLRGT